MIVINEKNVEDKIRRIIDLPPIDGVKMNYYEMFMEIEKILRETP